MSTDPADVAMIEPVTPGRIFALTADAGVSDFDIDFYPTATACADGSPPVPYRNTAGDQRGVVPAGAAVAAVSMYSGSAGSAFTYEELNDLPAANDSNQDPLTRTPTVIAIIDNGFSPYHYDFLASQHPWKRDGDLATNINFEADPSSYVAGHPGATPVHLTLPTSPDQTVSNLAGTNQPDNAAWKAMASTPVGAPANLYYFPGTKVIGAISFGTNPGPANLYANNDAHGTRTAASAAGNIHGTCPECLFVLVKFTTDAGLRHALTWVADQEWIDVVNNSYMSSELGAAAPYNYDGMLLGQQAEVTRRASLRGQTIVWASGNGLDGAQAVPQSTYWSSQSGPDWVVDVGGVSPNADQSFFGDGRPVDIAAYADLYPSTGGTTANDEGGHGGTSNAAPVVAGTFGHVIQLGRDLLGPSPVPAQPGVLAEGKKLHCDTPGAFCPLGDGQLTRHDVEQTVFRSVRPTPPRLDDGKYPRGNAAAALALPVHLFMAQGHGVVGGIKDPSRFRAEQRVLLDTLRGVATPLKRPPGELAWMVADSKCRQTLWPGEWHDGYYQQGDALVFDPATDSQAIALNGACSGLPPMPAEQAAPAHAALDPILATLPRVPTPGIG